MSGILARSTALVFSSALTLALPCHVYGDDARSNCAAVIEGRVLDARSNVPIARASVLVHLSGSATDKEYSGSADASGAFRLDGVASGTAFLVAKRDGYIPQPYGSARMGEPGDKVTIPCDDHIMGLILLMSPDAQIAGRVYDEQDVPARGATVSVVKTNPGRRSEIIVMARAPTNEEGEYVIKGLSRGTYYIIAEAESAATTNTGERGGGRLVQRTFYPNSVDLYSASPVVVGEGSTVVGTDVRLRTMSTGYEIKGHIKGDVGWPIQVELIPAVGPSTLLHVGRRIATVEEDGNFSFNSVARGTYELHVLASLDKTKYSELISTREILVGGDTDDITIWAEPPGKISGSIRVEDQRTDLSSALLTVISLSRAGFGRSWTSKIGNNGSFSITGVHSGEYVLQFNGLPRGLYISSLTVNRQNSSDLTLFVPGGGGSTEVEAILQAGTATVSGAVERPEDNTGKGKTGSSAVVVMVSNDPHPEGIGIRCAAVGADGHFTISDIRPGQYRAFGFEQVDDIVQLLSNPAVVEGLRSKGVGMDLQKNDSVMISLSTIPRAVVDEVLAIIQTLN